MGGHLAGSKKLQRPWWGWSGVHMVAAPIGAEAALRDVALLLPSRQASIETIAAKLLMIGGGYHRNLRQDEFGPTRAERMQAMRQVLDRLGTLSSRLAALPEALRLLVSERRTEFAEGPKDVDPVASYSADMDAIAVLHEIASDIHSDLIGTDDASPIEEVCGAADMVRGLLCNLDSTAEGDVVFDGALAGSDPADNSADPFESLCAPVRRLHDRFKLALLRLGRRKGPEPRVSLGLLVSQLCDLWRVETGRPVTANPVECGGYTGRPQSASGRFVGAAVEALQPSAAWISEHNAGASHKRALITLLRPAHRRHAVHSAMRAYVAADWPDPPAPRRGRPRRK